jgi:hypothetical protein
MSKDEKSVSKPPDASNVEAFLRKLADVPAPALQGGRGRLMFAMDATASREATWREAARIQEQMFVETAALGGLDVQLVYYRGFDECRASRWLSDADGLLAAMRKVGCAAWRTQIGRVLAHAVEQTGKMRLHALVFVGDCMEEDLDALLARAGQLALLGVPAFLFHEGGDDVAASAFAKIAKMTKGACCRFDASSPQQLRALLAAVAVYAAGGRKALADYGKRQGGVVLQITRQMNGT